MIPLHLNQIRQNEQSKLLLRRVLRTQTPATVVASKKQETTDLHRKSSAKHNKFVRN